ncbi:MAG: hypothetical protein ACRDG5_09480 [Anaerolineales bacterium]
MWLPLVAIIVAGLYFWLDRRGVWSRIGDSTRKPRPGRVRKPPARAGRRPELVDRLKVFQDFLENLPPGDEDADPPE